MAKPTTLDEIFDPALPLSNVALGTLSELGSDDAREFAARSESAPLERRLAIARRLVALSEDDPTLDYAGVFAVLVTDVDAEVRQIALDGLWEYDDRELIQPLITLMRTDLDDGVRASAALSLGRYVVLNEFEMLRPRDGTTVLSALRDAFRDEDQIELVRARALESVGASSEEWVRDLISSGFESGEHRMVLSALHAMGRNCDARWLPLLYDEMQNDDSERRFEAAGAAGAIGDEDAIPQLVDLFEDSDQEVQAAAIAAVGQIGGEVAIDILRENVANPDQRLADAFAAALAEAQGELDLLGDLGDDGLLEFDEEDELDDLDDLSDADG